MTTSVTPAVNLVDPALASASLAPAASESALLGNYKRAPAEFVGGEGVYLFDSTGKRYLDFVSGITVNALGYGDPGFVA